MSQLLRAGAAGLLALGLLVPVARAGSGGPDAAGYAWIDDADGCAPDGHPLELASSFGVGTNEWLVGPIELGFHFPFYDRVVTQAWLHVDGLVFFSPSWSGYLIENPPIPAVDGLDDGFIAPYLDWMEALEPAAWWERSPGNEEFRISFQGYLPFGRNDEVRYQLTLNRDGDIRIEYVSPGDFGASATIGIESPDQTTGLEIMRDGASPGGFRLDAPGRHALCIDRPRTLDCSSAMPLRCGFTSGSIPAGNASRVSDYLCAAGMTGPEVIYELRVTQPTDVQVTLTPSGGRDMRVFLLAGCTEHACIDGGGRIAGAQRLMAGTYRIVVEAATPADAGSFSLVTTCTPLATPLACGTPVAGTTEGGPSLLDGYRCLWGDFAGPEKAYIVNHAGGALFAQVDSPDGKAAFWFRADQPMGATECLAGGVGGAAIHDQPPGQYIVVVDGPAAGPFVLEVDCGAQIDCGAAPAIGCNEALAGTTVGAPSSTSFHACLPGRYSGPEGAFRFTNPVEQVVSLVLDDSADERLDLFLLSACDESRCVATGLDEISRTIPPGDYVVVVDGRDGAEAPFTLMAACGLALEPVLLETTLAPGDCVTEHKTAWLTPTVPMLDVLISLDVSGSFSAELVEIPNQLDAIMTAIDGFAGDVAYGVSSASDYGSEETGFEPCLFTGPNYGRQGFDYPYRLDQPITTDRAAVRRAIEALVPLDGLDDAESYELALQESWRDPATGWRPGARRVMLMFGDEVPHACNVLECLGDVARFSDGISFGLDGLANTPDDVLLLEAIRGMRDQDITLVFFDSGGRMVQAGDGSRGYRTYELWDCLAGRTGGSAERLNEDGTPMGAADLASVIMPLVRSAASWCDALELRASPGYESWLRSVTPVHASIIRPVRAEFDLEICVPQDAPEGVHEFTIEITCDGLPLASQRVRVVVASACAVAPPEIDRRSVRVRKSGGDLIIDWARGGGTHDNVYRGDIAAFATAARWNHGSFASGCRAVPPFTAAGHATQGGNAYYLIASACDGAQGAIEGPHGFGNDRRRLFPRSDAAGSPGGPCP